MRFHTSNKDKKWYSRGFENQNSSWASLQMLPKAFEYMRFYASFTLQMCREFKRVVREEEIFWLMDGKLYDVWITWVTFVQKLIWLGLASLTEHMHDSHTYKLDKLGEGIKNNIQQTQVLRQLYNTLTSNVCLGIHFCYFNFNHF